MTEQHFLTHIFKAKDFSDEELKTIISEFKKVNFSKNDYLLKEEKQKIIIGLLKVVLCVHML